MVETPVGGTKLDVGPLREAALAPGRFAAALGQDVGGLFQDLSQQIQETRNQKKVFDADIAMRTAKNNFVDELTKNPQLARDPGTWVPEWQKRSQEVSDKILSQDGLGPVLKNHLQQMSGVWTLDSTSEIRTQALRREVADTRKSGIAAANMAIQQGQPDQAIAAYKAMGEKGVLGPKTVDALIRQVPMQIAEGKANMLIAIHPIGAPDEIRKLEGQMPPNKFRSALRLAEQEQARAQVDNAEKLSGMVDDSPLHSIDPKMLTAWRDNKNINAFQYERIQSRIKSYEKAQAKEHNIQERSDYNEAMMRADHPPTDGTDLKEWAADVKSQGLGWTNPAYRRQLNQYVDRKVDHVIKTGHSFESQVERDIFGRMGREPLDPEGYRIKAVTRKLGTGDYQISDEDFAKQFPGKTRSDVVRSAQSVQAERYDKMRQWFADHKEKGVTEKEAEEYRQSLYRPAIEKTVSDAIDAAIGTP